MSEKMAESNVRETMTMKTRVGGGSTSKENGIEAKEENIEGNDKSSERNKFKKVEMPIFKGEDPEYWLFRADRYF